MKIQKVIFAAVICSYVQIVNAAFDGEFIDPTDMEHYDQTTKTLKFTLKEKESHKMLKGLFQRLLISAENCGLADKENHYDAEVILTRRAQVDLSNFLKDKPCDPEVIQDHLNRIFINFKKHNEDEWKLKFKEFFQMDISKVQKLRIIEEMFATHFKRILENTQTAGLEAILGGNIRLDDMKREINKFLNDEDWDQKKLEIILEHFTFTKDEGVNVWIYFWTFVLVCVISYALSWIMKKIYWREPAQNEARNIEEEEPEDDIDYQEEPFCLPVPETAAHNEVIQNIRHDHQRELNAGQDPMDEGTSKRLPMAQKFTQDEKKDKSREQDVVTVGAIEADVRLHCNERQEHADILNTEESSSPRTLETTVQNDAIEGVRSDIQTEPSAQQDENDVFSFIALENDQDENRESYEQACSPEPLHQCSSSPKDENSMETKQTLSQSLSNETTQVRTAHGDKESTDSPDYTQELYTDTDAASAEKVNVDIVCDTHRPQDSSMSGDDESDFIVISESAPESLTFVQDTTCNEPAEIL